MPTGNQLVTGGPLSVATKGSIGFVLSQEQFPTPRLLEIGMAAEKAGFDMVWNSDHFHPWQDNQGHAGLAWITLAALGQRVSRLALGTGVTCPTFRYRPAIVAEAFASLGLLYPGRVFLGVGTGEALNEVPAGGGWGHYEERAERLIEAVDIIRQLWSGELVNHKGQYYQVEGARLYDLPTQPIPIYIAAGGEKSAHLAGKYGDGLISDLQRAVQPAMRQGFEAGAREAGKDPSQMPIIAEAFVVVGDEQEARKWLPLWRFLPKAWEEFVDDPSPVDIEQKAKRDVPMEELLKAVVVGSDPQVHIEALQKHFDQGVTHIFVHSPQEDQQSVLDFYADKVLPKVRSALAR